MRLLIVPATIISLLVLGVGSAAAAKPSSGQPDFGPNVLIFDPSMSTSQIQAAVDAVAAQQVPNQFGTQRYALLFKPGTYGTAQNPLNFQVGYYTSVAGLGREPGDVTVNGSIYVRNQCTATGCVALNNFWRSLSNLTINVNTPNFGCYSGEFWAVSQAAPMRRVHVNGLDHADGLLHRPVVRERRLHRRLEVRRRHVVNGSQQQWVTRNSTLDGWTNGVWNQVFSGVVNAPAQCFPGVPNVLWPVHDDPDEHGAARCAVPLRGLGRPLQRLRPGGAAQLGRRGLGGRLDPRLVDPDRRLLHRQALGRRAGDQQRARARPEPDLHAGRLPPRHDDQGEARRHGRARPRLPDARSRERRRRRWRSPTSRA